MNTLTSESLPWRRHLVVVTLGSFVTVSAMGLVLPFLPLFLGELGVHESAVAAWSGFAYSATFLTAGLTAPLWGRLGDRWGRKPMLLRASLGLAIAMTLTGLAQNEWQLVGLRLLTGLLGGYSSGAVILVAAQAPRERSGWALGILSSGATAGLLAGPVLGGILPPLIGVRNTFFAAGAAVFVSFLATLFILRRDRPALTNKASSSAGPARNRIVPLLLVSGLLISATSLTIEPVLALFVGKLVRDPASTTLVAGLVFAATATGSLLSSTVLGRLADRVAPPRVFVGCLIAAAVFVIPQAFVTDAWELGELRFLLGCALGGLIPSLTATLRRTIPGDQVGRVLGLSTSAQYAGQVAGPVAGGVLAGWGGISLVLLGTGIILFFMAAVGAVQLRKTKVL